jgi:peptide/nickel transport system permease protein
MITRLLTSLLEVLGIMAGVGLLVFALLRLVPGDPVDAMLGESARPADRAELRAALGLDRTMGAQLLSYYQGLLRLDLGESIQQRRPVRELLAERLPATLQLAAAAAGVALALALPLGILAARHRDRWPDVWASGFAVAGQSIPNFWLGPVLILVFSLGLGLTPVSGDTEPGSLILPAITLGASLAALTTRMVRSALLEVLEQDFIRTARAKGLNGGAVVWRHALPNAALPVITLVGLQLGALLAGAVITETVFAWPGIGRLLIEAIQQRDYPLVQGCVLLVSCSYVLLNRGTDLLYQMIDPRLRRRS